MITINDFLKNKENIQNYSKYKHLEYDDPGGLFNVSLDYNYLFGWTCGIHFPENPSIALSFEDEEDAPCDKIIESVNKCLPFFNRIKNEEGESEGFILEDFNKVNNGYYEYKDERYSLFLKLLFNGKNYCELSAFFGDPGKPGISAFFEQDTVEHTLASFNQCLLTLLDMYNIIKDSEKN